MVPLFATFRTICDFSNDFHIQHFSSCLNFSKLFALFTSKLINSSCRQDSHMNYVNHHVYELPFTRKKITDPMRAESGVD